MSEKIGDFEEICGDMEEMTYERKYPELARYIQDIKKVRGMLKLDLRQNVRDQGNKVKEQHSGNSCAISVRAEDSLVFSSQYLRSVIFHFRDKLGYDNFVFEKTKFDLESAMEAIVCRAANCILTKTPFQTEPDLIKDGKAFDDLVKAVAFRTNFSEEFVSAFLMKW